MASIGTYHLPSHRKGDTFNALNFAIDEGGVDLNLTGATIVMKFRKGSPRGLIALTLSVGSGLTLVSASEGTFKIDEQVITLDAGKYYYDMTITLSSGRVITWLRGTWLIDEDE